MYIRLNNANSEEFTLFTLFNHTRITNSKEVINFNMFTNIDMIINNY